MVMITVKNKFVEAKHGDTCCNVIIWEVRQKNHKPETQWALTLKRKNSSAISRWCPTYSLLPCYHQLKNICDWARSGGIPLTPALGRQNLWVLGQPELHRLSGTRVWSYLKAVLVICRISMGIYLVIRGCSLTSNLLVSKKGMDSGKG